MWYTKEVIDYREQSINQINQQLHDKSFKCRNTNGCNGFVRDRKLGFKELIILIGQGMVKSIQRELNNFYAKLKQEDYSIQEVTKGALSHARKKLKPDAFAELNQTVVKTFYLGAPYTVWYKHRLLAVDGSKLNLPAHPSVVETFGEHGFGNKADCFRSMATISTCYDVLNLLTLDARIDRFDCSEQTLLKQHLQAVEFKEHDIILLDRGYPSISLMYSLHQRGIGFCMRMKDNWWLEVKNMVEQNEQDKEVIFKLPSKDLHLMQEFETDENFVKCRLVAIELDNGQKEILCVSLLDKEQYAIEDIKQLYHFRWNIEEAYKLFKCRAGLEVFSGKTANAVKQDFFAKIFMMTLCAVLTFPIEARVRSESEQNGKHPRQINRTNAIAYCRESWLVLWLRKTKDKFLESFDKMLYKTTDIVRTGRKFPRNHKTKHPPAMTYKQL